MTPLRSIAIAALLWSSSARADDHYVDLDAGSDAALGTSAAPWRTLTFAMATVAPSSGHRVLVRGAASTASPGESFPIRVPAGISLEAWDAQQGAVIDASPLACLEIAGPAHRGQSIRGFARNLRLVGTPAISVPVVGIDESVDLVVEGCNLWGDLRLELAEQSGQTRTGSCALALRDCEVSGEVLVECLTTSISPVHDVLSATLVDNDVYGYVSLRRLSAPSKPLELLRNGGWYSASLADCSASNVLIQDNDLRSMVARVSATSVLCERNHAWWGQLSIAARGRLEVLSNTVDLGGLEVRGRGTERIHDNRVREGWLSFSADGALDVPCSLLRNRSTFLEVDALGTQPLTIADNAMNGLLTLGYLPHAPVEVARNTIYPSFGFGNFDGIVLRRAISGEFPGAPLVTIADNEILGFSRYDVGILVEATLAKLVIERNRIADYEIGIQITDAAVVHGSPSGWNFRIEHNAIYGNRTGVDLGLGGSQEDLRFLNNEIVSREAGLLVGRSTYRGTIRCWNNIITAEGNSAVSGSFAPIDLVWNNLCSDGSLLALHPTNITGDPQFDPASGRLRSSSPAVGSGIDPLTALPGFNMGRDPLQPEATLQFRAQSETAATLQLDAPGSSVALLLFGLAASDPADVALCDGLLGVDLSSWLFSIAQPVSNGTLLLPLTLPPGPWTVVVQALSDVASAVPPCRASNTVVVRR